MAAKAERKTLLITGGSGYLGQHLLLMAAADYNLFASYNRQKHEVKAGQAVQLDLTSQDDVLGLVQDIAPQAIIHTAAANPGQDGNMMQVNAEGSRFLAQAAAAVGARLVHVSTDLVHDGKHAPYADDVSPTPMNSYGRSKTAAEQAVAAVDPGAAIVRTSLIYGLKVMDRGTAGFVERLQSGESLTLFSDVIRQPVWVETLALALLKLSEIDYGGPLNVVGRQAMTREEFGRKMLTWWGVEAAGLIRSGRAADISDTIPLDVRLTVEKGETLLGMTFPGVDEVLKLQRGPAQ